MGLRGCRTIALGLAAVAVGNAIGAHGQRVIPVLTVEVVRGAAVRRLPAVRRQGTGAVVRERLEDDYQSTGVQGCSGGSTPIAKESFTLF